MILCFECSINIKRQVDQLLGSGRYTSLSELITVAISNQAMLHEHVAKDGSVVFADSSLAPTAPEHGVASVQTGVVSPGTPSADISKRRVNGISALFTHRASSCAGPIADLPDDPVTDHPDVVKPSRWIFGQYNRLLPAKASCRALANLLVNETGIVADIAAKKIAAEATELGNYLRILDRRNERTRDEQLCTAFPGHADPDKGRLRYANQFVAAVDKQGRLSGLLFDLKLINRISHRESRISLTNAGWQFALMENPVLDNASDAVPGGRFSRQEQHFLLSHIATNVPRERGAYQAILNAIAQGQNTPEGLSELMRVIEDNANDRSSLLATQRAGAISRMSDLALLVREREGIRVRYGLTEDGSHFLRDL